MPDTRSDTTKSGKKSVKKRNPVKFPCGHCHDSTSGTAALLCNIREFWHHASCIPGMSDESYKSLLSMKESLGYSFFLCAKCEKVNKKTWQSVNQLSQRIDKIENRLSDLEKSISASVSSIETTNNQVKKVQEQHIANQEHVKATVLNEMLEQEKRKSNVILYNLEESSASESISRSEEDKQKVLEIFNTIGLQGDEMLNEISYMKRLGKRSSGDSVNDEIDNVAQVRPLLLSFKDVQAQKSILSNAKKLANSNYIHVSVKQDLTKSQQKIDKDLRNEVKTLNESQPVDNNGPFLWKVVGMPGTPSRRKVKVKVPVANQS